MSIALRGKVDTECNLLYDEIDLDPAKQSRERQVALAHAAHGMWADWKPDTFLATSRARLSERDEELGRNRSVYIVRPGRITMEEPSLCQEA